MSVLAGVDHRPAAVILDFDGVVLGSVEIKAQAYAEIYREEEASKIVEIMGYQHFHGGVSRREKFRYFEREVFGRVGDQGTIEKLSAHYTSIVHELLFSVPSLTVLMISLHQTIDGPLSMWFPALHRTNFVRLSNGAL